MKIKPQKNKLKKKWALCPRCGCCFHIAENILLDQPLGSFRDRMIKKGE